MAPTRTTPCRCWAWVHRCHYDHALDHPLESFETEPAREGGSSWLGLVGGSRQWLLLHEYSPFNSFAISVHGPSEYCRAVATGVGIGLNETQHHTGKHDGTVRWSLRRQSR